MEDIRAANSETGEMEIYCAKVRAVMHMGSDEQRVKIIEAIDEVYHETFMRAEK